MKHLNLLTIIFTLFISNFLVFANNNTNANTNNSNILYFEINNKTAQYSFSANDARQLEKYLVSNHKITACDQENLSVMIDTDAGQQNIVQELYTKGYAVLALSCSQQNITITLSKTANDLAMVDARFKKQEMLAKAKLLEKNNALVEENKNVFDDECNDCGIVSISEDILNEFKATNYSGQLIDFGTTETTIEQVANMENESNIFAVESENITCEECEASLLTEGMLDDAVNKLKSAANNELVEDALELELENSSVYRTPNK